MLKKLSNNDAKAYIVSHARNYILCCNEVFYDKVYLVFYIKYDFVLKCIFYLT